MERWNFLPCADALLLLSCSSWRLLSPLPTRVPMMIQLREVQEPPSGDVQGRTGSKRSRSPGDRGRGSSEKGEGPGQCRQWRRWTPPWGEGQDVLPQVMAMMVCVFSLNCSSNRNFFGLEKVPSGNRLHSLTLVKTLFWGGSWKKGWYPQKFCQNPT